MAYRIFLVDNDTFLLDLYAVKFKNAGHEVSVFHSGDEFLKALKSGTVPSPDAILLDLVMPGVGGFETLEAMRKESLAKGSKVIILSNQGQDSDFEKAKRLGVDGYIVKASAIPAEVIAETLRSIESPHGAVSPSGAAMAETSL